MSKKPLKEIKTARPPQRRVTARGPAKLQSLNEELTALNNQLQEALMLQQITSNDLQNVLYSTNVATIFLDSKLNIRLFTPATKLLFSVIPSDVGRPLADLSSLAADSALLSDARIVLQSLEPLECEIEAKSGAWYIRRILPYRTQNNGVEGVVITFADITERRHTTDALGAAKREAQLANIAKSRFLAAASHDLRQPLQALVLLQALLAKNVEGAKAQKLVARLDETLVIMSSMFNALLDINQIESGTVRAEMISFPIKDLLERLGNEFTHHAQAKKLTLRVVPCDLLIYSDPGLLEQIIRNLLSNALKYTKRGKILLGCRRHEEILSIEVWDTGIGIPEQEFQAIFEEYYQLDNAARERRRGLGLGLSIVQRLGSLLDHRIRVRSQLGKGSVFAVKVPRPSVAVTKQVEQEPPHKDIVTVEENVRRTGVILLIEDDAELSDLLDMLLTDEGHDVTTAPDGIVALEMVTKGQIQPNLIIADYNLPNGLNGLQLTAKLREKLGNDIPVIILTGDISTDTFRNIANSNCAQLNKPVKVTQLTHIIQQSLGSSSIGRKPASLLTETPIQSESSVVFIVDDDHMIRESIRSVLEDDGQTVEDYETCEAFLKAYRPGREACLLIDAYLPGMSGL